MSFSIEPESKGALFIVSAAALWAAGYFFRKTILYGLSPLLLTFLTSAIVAIFLGLVFRFRPAHIFRCFSADPWRYFGLAFTGVVMGSTCMFIALDHLDLGLTVILEKLQPIFTLLLASLFLGERPSPSRRPWIFLALLASYFVSMRHPFDWTLQSTDPRGVIAVMLAAFFWAVASIIGKDLTTRQPDSRMITFLRFALGALLMLPIFFSREALHLRMQLDGYVFSVVVLCAVLSTGLGYLLFYSGLRTVTATVSGFLELVTPVVAVLLGVVFLGERYTIVQALAAITLLVAIYRITRPESSTSC